MSDEKVLLHTKLQGGSNSNDEFSKIKKLVAADIGSQRAAADIAKSLTMDFVLLINIAVAKAVFGNIKNKEDIINGLKEMWDKRTSANLSIETKMFQDAIFNAVNQQSEVSEQMTEKMNEQLKKYCDTRDAAVELSNEAVKGIIDTILNKDTEKKDEAK